MYICVNLPYIYATVSIYTYIYLYMHGNGKRKFVFLGRQTINGNRPLLFQQLCPSMPASTVCIERQQPCSSVQNLDWLTLAIV